VDVVIIDLVQIKRLGEEKVKENEQLRVFMKRHGYPERGFRKMAEEIEEGIDCRACANCCKVGETNITERDVERAAKYLRLKPGQFIAQYTTTSAFEDETILRRNEQGCIFLDGNDCSIYDARPDTCRYFPHLVRGQGPMVTRMWNMVDRATYCPIVYNTLEAFKEALKFGKGRDK
jgi:Fe-S-cluster containining protein